MIKLYYKDHLFKLTEMVDDKTMEDLGRQWFRAHDERGIDRFGDSVKEKSEKIGNTFANPLIKKSIAKRKELENALLSAPEGRYESGGPKTKEYYLKALNHLKVGSKNPLYASTYSERVRRYAGHKIGFEDYPGVDRSKELERFKKEGASIAIQRGWASHKDLSAGKNTMQQRAGEHRSMAINRLVDYMNKNGINQENPTSQDRENYQNWVNRTNGRFLHH